MNQLHELKEIISISDLGCAGAVVALGHEIKEIDRTDERKAKFIFQRDKTIEQTINDYWSDDLKITARVFFENIRYLKNLLYRN